MYVCAGGSLLRSEDNLQELTLSPITWETWIELKSSGSVASSLTPWVLSPAQGAIKTFVFSPRSLGEQSSRQKYVKGMFTHPILWKLSYLLSVQPSCSVGSPVVLPCWPINSAEHMLCHCLTASVPNSRVMASLVLPSLFSHKDKKQKILEKIGGQFVPDRAFVFMNIPTCTCTDQLVTRDRKCLMLRSQQWNSIAVERGGAESYRPTFSVCCNSKQKLHPGKLIVNFCFCPAGLVRAKEYIRKEERTWKWWLTFSTHFSEKLKLSFRLLGWRWGFQVE